MGESQHRWKGDRSRAVSRSMFPDAVLSQVATDADGGGMDERRGDHRTNLDLPCKVWHPRAMRFLPGVTQDLSRDGLCVALRSGVPFRPGDRIRIGLPPQGGAIVLRGGDLIEGTVLRSTTEDGRVLVAIAFEAAGDRAASNSAPQG